MKVFKTCNTCLHKTKTGKLCKRTTCKNGNLPYCWQHMPLYMKKEPFQARLDKVLHVPTFADRNDIVEHLLIVHGETPQQKAEISDIMQKIYGRRNKWHMKIWRDQNRKVKAHIIAYKAYPLSRLARQHMPGKARELRKLVKNSETMYIESLEVQNPHKHRNIESVLIRSFQLPMLTCINEKKKIRNYKKNGFKKLPSVSTASRTCMIRE